MRKAGMWSSLLRAICIGNKTHKTKVSRSREMNPAMCWVSCGNHFLQVHSPSNDLAEQAPKADLNSALGFQHWCDLHGKLVQVTVAYKC